MNFSTLKSLTIPEGKVIKIQVGGKTLWQEKAEVTAPKFNYVSLGDSIAAGHRIDENWETDYGWDSQYRKTDPNTGKVNTETVIVPNCYTDKIRKYLQGIYGANNVSTKSFAVSGSMIFRKHGDNRSLIEVIEDDVVNQALSKANLVTISIGANTILEPALDRAPSFLTEGGSLSELEKTVEGALRELADPNYEYSYKKLFDKLCEINPNAKYVFTTIHNPMKYLYVERGTYDNDFQDGFLGTWLNTIPQMSVAGLEVDREIKKLILDTKTISDIRTRVNGDGAGWEGIGAWTERYIETGGVSVHDGKQFPSLNQTIRSAIAEYNNPNFTFTETHELFDTVPDRQGAGEVHYNDLVNMQITRGYDANDLDWSELWGEAEGSTVEEKIRNYWMGIINEYLDGFSFDFDGLAAEIEPIIVDNILSKAFDPHPRTDGHYVMYRSFVDTLGWNSLYTIDYNANGGLGTMETQKVLDASIVNGVSKKIYSIINANNFSPMAHYHFNGWKDNDGNRYSDKQAIYVTNNMLLSAQWAIATYTLTVVQGAPNAVSLAKLFSRDYDNRKLYIGDFSRYLNSDKTTWDLPLKNTETFTVAYGEPIKMMVTGNVERIIPIGTPPKPNCSISQYVGGENYEPKVTAKVAEANFTMPDRDITIEYHFNYGVNIQYSHSYWLGYIGDKDLTVTYSGRDS